MPKKHTICLDTVEINIDINTGSNLNDATFIKRFKLSISDSSNFELDWILKAWLKRNGIITFLTILILKI